MQKGPITRTLSFVTAVAAVAAMAGCTGTRPAREAEVPSTGSDPSTASSSRAAGWIVFAVGAQAGAVAIGTSALMLHADSVRSDQCNAAKICTAEGLEANNNLRDLAPWNVGAWVVAAAGVGGGLWLVLTHPDERKAIGVAPGPGGAVLEGRF